MKDKHATHAYIHNGCIHALTMFKSAAMYFEIVELDPIQEFVESAPVSHTPHTKHNSSVYTTPQSTQLVSFSNLSELIPLVSRSATMSSEGQYFKQILLAVTCSRIK